MVVDVARKLDMSPFQLSLDLNPCVARRPWHHLQLHFQLSLDLNGVEVR